MTTTFEQLRTEGVPTKDACALIGRARATHYRRLQPPVHGPAPARASPDNGQALSAAERAAVLALINTEANAELSIGQIWARELDEGRTCAHRRRCTASPALSGRAGNAAARPRTRRR